MQPQRTALQRSKCLNGGMVVCLHGALVLWLCCSLRTDVSVTGAPVFVVTVARHVCVVRAPLTRAPVTLSADGFFILFLIFLGSIFLPEAKLHGHQPSFRCGLRTETSIGFGQAATSEKPTGVA